MQISRLFEIVYILLDKKATTAKELAERFEVSTRTIYRDIDVLCQSGIPIYASRGKGGGITLLDNFVLNKSVLSDDEQRQILMALQSLTATQYPDARRILSKLSSLFKKDDLQWIEVDFSPWGSRRDQKEQFDLLKKAVLQQRVVGFEYFNAAGEKSHRRVEPLKLIFKDKAWYLWGFCLDQQAGRTFKLSRMRDIQPTETVFTKRPSEASAIGFQEKQLEEILDIRLQIAPEGAYRVYDEFDDQEVEKNQDGSFMVKTALPGGDWLYHYILSFGPLVEVIAPSSLRKIIRLKLEAMLEKYQ